MDLSGYKLGTALGSGSFGEVRLATEKSTGKKVAIKAVAKSSVQDIAEVERVSREFYILTSLNHKNVIQLYEVLQSESHLYLVMEYAGGGSLDEYVSKTYQGGKCPDERTAKKLFVQILAAVKYCHRKHIIHRDLKPENILMTSAGQVKVADFGLSNTVAYGARARSPVGTPLYAAPEVLFPQMYPELDKLFGGKPAAGIDPAKDVRDGRRSRADSGTTPAAADVATPALGAAAAAGPELDELGLPKADGEGGHDSCEDATGASSSKSLSDHAARAQYSPGVADVWSLGCILHRLVFGVLPYPANTIRELKHGIFGAPWSPPGPCSPSLASLLRGMLQKDPLARMTAEQVSAHPWTESGGRGSLPSLDMLDSAQEAAESLGLIVGPEHPAGLRGDSNSSEGAQVSSVGQAAGAGETPGQPTATANDSTTADGGAAPAAATTPSVTPVPSPLPGQAGSAAPGQGQGQSLHLDINTEVPVHRMFAVDSFLIPMAQQDAAGSSAAAAGPAMVGSPQPVHPTALPHMQAAGTFLGLPGTPHGTALVGQPPSSGGGPGAVLSPNGFTLPGAGQGLFPGPGQGMGLVGSPNGTMPQALPTQGIAAPSPHGHPPFSAAPSTVAAPSPAHGGGLPRAHAHAHGLGPTGTPHGHASGNAARRASITIRQQEEPAPSPSPDREAEAEHDRPGPALAPLAGQTVTGSPAGNAISLLRARQNTGRRGSLLGSVALGTQFSAAAAEVSSTAGPGLFGAGPSGAAGPGQYGGLASLNSAAASIAGAARGRRGSASRMGEPEEPTGGLGSGHGSFVLPHGGQGSTILPPVQSRRPSVAGTPGQGASVPSSASTAAQLLSPTQPGTTGHGHGQGNGPGSSAGAHGLHIAAGKGNDVGLSSAHPSTGLGIDSTSVTGVESPTEDRDTPAPGLQGHEAGQGAGPGHVTAAQVAAAARQGLASGHVKVDGAVDGPSPVLGPAPAAGHQAVRRASLVRGRLAPLAGLHGATAVAAMATAHNASHAALASLVPGPGSGDAGSGAPGVPARNTPALDKQGQAGAADAGTPASQQAEQFASGGGGAIKRVTVTGGQSAQAAQAGGQGHAAGPKAGAPGVSRLRATHRAT